MKKTLKIAGIIWPLEKQKWAMIGWDMQTWTDESTIRISEAARFWAAPEQHL